MEEQPEDGSNRESTKRRGCKKESDNGGIALRSLRNVWQSVVIKEELAWNKEICEIEITYDFWNVCFTFEE